MRKYTDETILTETFGKSPVIKIIDFFFDNPGLDYSKEEIIKGLGMSKVTFYKYFALLEENGIMEGGRKVGKARMYKLNEKNDVVKKLKELVWILGISAMQKSVEETGTRIPVYVKKRH